MKGWIEVTISASGEKELIKVDEIFRVRDQLLYLYTHENWYQVKETYDELKAKILAASEGE